MGPLSNDGLAIRLEVQAPPGTGFTVTTRLSGVGSARPRPSVTVKVTVNVPALANATRPGFCWVEFAAPPPKFHAKVSGRLLFESVPVPVKLTLWPAAMVTAPVGVLITPLGAGLALTVTVRVAGVASARPAASVTVKLTA